MKNHRLPLRIAALAALAATTTACGGKYEECPTISKGYVTDFILPAPTLLSAEDKNFLEELRREYNESLDKEEATEKTTLQMELH